MSFCCHCLPCDCGSTRSDKSNTQNLLNQSFVGYLVGFKALYVQECWKVYIFFSCFVFCDIWLHHVIKNRAFRWRERVVRNATWWHRGPWVLLGEMIKDTGSGSLFLIPGLFLLIVASLSCLYKLKPQTSALSDMLMFMKWFWVHKQVHTSGWADYGVVVWHQWKDQLNPSLWWHPLRRLPRL